MAKKLITNQELTNEFASLAKFGENLLYVDEWSAFALSDEGTFFRMLDSEDLHEEIWRFVTKSHPEVNVTIHLVRDIYQQLRYACRNRVAEADLRYIAFDDCVYDMRTFSVVPAGTKVRAFHKIPVSLETAKTMKMPNFERYLETSLVYENTTEHDRDLALLMQEMFGNVLLPSMKAAAAFFLTGNGFNGKSVAADLLMHVAGPEFTKSVTLESIINNRFITASLVGKRLNVCGEEESKFMRSDKFKALVAGDMTTAEHKFGGTFDFRPKCKFVFSTNDPPSFTGMNYGLRRRIKIIPYYRQFTAKEHDPEILDKILTELPAVIWWSIEGARRLYRNNYFFTASSASSNELQNFENEVSSSLHFFRERFEPSSEELDFVSNEEMYSEYKAWCLENGRKSMSSSNFIRDITRNLGVQSGLFRVNGVPKRGKMVKRIVLTVPEGTKELIDVANLKF